MSIVLVSHDMGVIAQTCDRVAVMYAGHIVEVATVGDLFARPEHPYTQALLAAMPRIDGGATRGELQAIPGQPPDVRELPAGCPFTPRCAHAREGCESVSMELERVRLDHVTACPFVRSGDGSARSGTDQGPSRERPAPDRARALEVVPDAAFRGRVGPARAPAAAGRRRSGVSRARPARGARHRRRVGERQDDPRPLPEPSPRAERGQHRLRRDGRPYGRPGRASRCPAPHADGVPGSVHVAEPATDRRRRDPRGRASPWALRQGDWRGIRRRATRDGRALAASRRPAPAGALGRAASACRDRSSPGSLAGRPHRRRSGLESRRFDPSADPEPLRGAPPAASS